MSLTVKQRLHVETLEDRLKQLRRIEYLLDGGSHDGGAVLC